jgi:hypothetical protein
MPTIHDAVNVLNQLAIELVSWVFRGNSDGCTAKWQGHVTRTLYYNRLSINAK